MKPTVCCLIFVFLCAALVGCAQLSTTAKNAAPSALRVPPGFRAKEGTVPEPYTKTGWAKEVIHEKTGIEMVFIPAGEFMMGSPDSEKDRGSNDEGPLHKVRITKPFYLGKSELTNAQYRLYKPSHDSGAYMGRTLNNNRQPVVSVSWNDAKSYCDWAGLELPTEAQWEYSCRAGSKGRFWWGDSESDAGRHANVADRTAKAKWGARLFFDTDDGNAVASAVGTYDANAFGLYDIIGNAWEWCSDYWHTPYGADSVSDPAGPSSGTSRVLRGGSWDSGPPVDRSAARLGSDPSLSVGNLGFRVARGL